MELGVVPLQKERTDSSKIVLYVSIINKGMSCYPMKDGRSGPGVPPYKAAVYTDLPVRADSTATICP